MVDSLTTNLRLELEKANQSFNRWTESKHDCIGNSSANYDRMMEEFDTTIRALKERDYELEASRPMQEKIRKQQQQEIEQLLSKEQLMKQRLGVLYQQLRNCEESEEKERVMLENARAENEEVRRKMEQSLNDLTYGIRHFTSLGLEFQKAEGDCMKFIFTQIDPSDTNRPFYFIMYVDASNLYQVVETNPAIEPGVIHTLTQELNAGNDISLFVLKIRKIFRKMVL